MFSRRTGWNREVNHLARRLEALRAEGRSLIDLTETNPTAVGLSPGHTWIASTLSGSGDLASYVPDPRGILVAREALATWLTSRGPQPVSPDDLLLSSSTSEAYSWLFKLLCEPGDDVLVPHPAYPLFEYLTALEGIGTREYPLHFDGEWHLDVEDLAAVASDRTRAILVVNPGNPTGAFLKRGELELLWRLCSERGWALISDEVFADYGNEPGPSNRVTRAALPEAKALTFSLSGLSKVAGLPQLKLSWILAAGPPELRQEAMARLELIADTYLSVNSPAQRALPGLLSGVLEVQERIKDRVRMNRERLIAYHPADAAWTVMPAEGGWSAVIRIPSRVTEEEVCLLLLDEGVVVHPGYFFDFAASCYLVVSLLPEAAAFAEGARRVASVLNAI